LQECSIPSPNMFPGGTSWPRPRGQGKRRPMSWSASGRQPRGWDEGRGSMPERGVAGEKELESYRVRGPGGCGPPPHSAVSPSPISPSPPPYQQENSPAGSALPTKVAGLRKAMGGRHLFPGWSSSTRNLPSTPLPGFGRRRESAPWTMRWKGSIPPNISARRYPLPPGIALSLSKPPLSAREPRDLESRLHCQMGAWMSIFGGMSVRTGISHAIGHQLGGHCNVPTATLPASCSPMRWISTWPLPPTAWPSSPKERDRHTACTC